MPTKKKKRQKKKQKKKKKKKGKKPVLKKTAYSLPSSADRAASMKASIAAKKKAAKKPKEKFASMKKYIGNISAIRALERKVTRFGRGVMSQSLELEKQRGVNAQQIIDQALADLAKLKKTARTRDQITSYEHQEHILDVLKEAGERPVHATELVAALAFEKGLEKEKLLPVISACRLLKKRHPFLYEGTTSGVESALGLNLLFRIHDKLLKAKDTVLDSRDLAYRLGYDVDTMAVKDKNLLRTKITNALGVLDLMNLAVKLPVHARSFQWIHADYRISPKTLPTWNVGWQLLQVLKEKGPKSLIELMSPAMRKPIRKMPLGKWRGELNIGLSAVTLWFDNLRDAGIVDARMERQKSRGRKKKRYFLTEEGEKLMAEQDARVKDKKKKAKGGSLHPTLRRVLLGSYLSGLKPTERDMYNKIIRWIRIEEARKAYPRLGYQALSRKIGESITYVNTLFHGRYPHRKVTLSKLKNLYLPVMQVNNPSKARFFERWIKDEEAKKPKK